MHEFRSVLRGASIALTLVVTACATATAPSPAGPAGIGAITPRQTAFLDTLEQRTFNWFWERTDARTGLTPDRWPTPSFSSVAAVGFALTAYPIGIEPLSGHGDGTPL